MYHSKEEIKKFIDNLKTKSVIEIIKLLKTDFVIQRTDVFKLKTVFCILDICINNMSGTSDYYKINEYNGKWMSTNVPQGYIVTDKELYSILYKDIDQVQIIEF